MTIRLCVLSILSCWTMAQGPTGQSGRPPQGMPIVHLIHLADANGDQVTTREEWAVQLDQLSELGQGEINDSAIRQYLEAHRPGDRPKGPDRPDARPSHDQKQGRPAPPTMNRQFLEKQFSELDKDGDGSVSHQELPSRGGPPPRD
ncbi:MAG: hypothetical protein KDC35_21140 [Acidobacteria bacterium]|nr:hypothetical protein [Acidobacteriota bacterium]